MVQLTGKSVAKATSLQARGVESAIAAAVSTFKQEARGWTHTTRARQYEAHTRQHAARRRAQPAERAEQELARTIAELHEQDGAYEDIARTWEGERDRRLGFSDHDGPLPRATKQGIDHDGAIAQWQVALHAGARRLELLQQRRELLLKMHSLAQRRDQMHGSAARLEAVERALNA